MGNDDAIEKKLLGILKEITGRSGTTVSEILKVDYFTETDQKKITDAIKKMTPKDPGLDSVADLLKKRGDEILGQLKKLNQEIQNKSKKDPAKIEFYKGQALYDDINSESFTKNYLYIRHNRLSTLNMIAINNNYAKAEIDYHSSNTPEKHLKDYEQFARKDLMIGLENIASAYAGKKTLSGAKLPKEMWSRETALKYAKEAYEQGSKFGAELIADIHPDDSQGLRYAIILSKIGNKKAPLTLESAKKFYGKSTDIDLYLKAGLIKQ